MINVWYNMIENIDEDIFSNFLETKEGGLHKKETFKAIEIMQEDQRQKEKLIIDINENDSDFLMFPKPYTNDPYAQKYGNKYTTKMDYLSNSLLDFETGEKIFKVISVEAGLGKSLQTNITIRNHLNEFLTDRSPRNFLIVKKFKEDIEETVRFIQKYPGDKDVLGITSDNWSTEWVNKLDELKEIRVIVISHARYMLLCLQDEHRLVFSEGRHTLVMDEKLQFPSFTFSAQTYKDVQTFIPPELDSDYIRISTPFLKMIKQQKHLHDPNKCSIVSEKIEVDRLEEFQEKIMANSNSIRNREMINSYLDTLKIISSSDSLVYHAQRIATFDKRQQMWGLKNNIILDASADLDYTYRISSLIKLHKYKEIVKHNKSIIHRVNFNAGKQSIHNNKTEYFAKLCSLIAQNKEENDKILIVCLKVHKQLLIDEFIARGITSIGVGNDYNNEEIAINWFGNLVGKNLYKDFNKCWIVGTPNIPLEAHVVDYFRYKGSDVLFKKGNTIEIQKGRFKNTELKSLQVSHLVSEIYQSLKRIQRNVLPNAEYYIVNSDEAVYEKVVKKMYGVRRGNVIELGINKIDKRKEFKNSKIDELVKHLKQLPKGQHRKKDIREKLGFTVSNFGRYLNLNNIRINELVELGLIKMQKQYIERL